MKQARPYAAGLLAYAGGGQSAMRLEDALERAPWRGHVAARHAAAFGDITALGSAALHHHLDVTLVLHERIDNLELLAHRVGRPPDDVGAVVASVYRMWGDEFARQLIGDFAIVLVDDSRHTMVAARDWIGARPLFWGEYQGRTAFASEVKQVLALLGRPFQIDEDMLALYEQNEPIPADGTFAVGVRAVLPSGQVAVRDGRSARAWRCPVYFEPIEITAPEAAVETRRLLEQAVGRRTRGARSLAALVSGGVDSTSVAVTAAYLAEHHGGPPVQRAFTLSYPELPECDETALARLVAERWQICHEPVPLDPDAIPAGYADECALHDGPPFPSVGQPLLYAHAGRCGADVLLTGQMADIPLEQRGNELLLALMRWHWRDALRWSALYARHRPRAGLHLWARAARRGLRGERAEQLFERRLEGYTGRLSLELEERAGVHAGVRVEAPFADEELLRFLAGLPPGVRTDPGRLLTKAVLRNAMEGLLPDEVRLRHRKPTFDAVLMRALGADAASLHITVARAYGSAFRAVQGAQTEA